MSNTFTSSDIVGFFLSDANEHLQTISDDLLDLEQNQGDLSLVDKIFRAIHAIKGSAGMSGFYVVSQLAHRVEDLLSKLREREMDVSGDIIDLLFQGIDTLTRQIDNISNGQPEDESSLQMVVELYAEILGVPASTPPPGKPKQPASPAPKAAAGKANPPKQPAAKPDATPAARSTVKPAAPAKIVAPAKPPLPAPAATATSHPSKVAKPAASPKPVVSPKPAISESELAERYIKEDQVDQAVVIYRNLLRKTPNNPSLRQRLEETIALQLYLRENPA